MFFQCHDAAGQSSHIRMQSRYTGMAACPVFIEFVDNLRLISQTDVGNAVPLIVGRHTAAFVKENDLMNAPCRQCFLEKPSAVFPADGILGTIPNQAAVMPAAKPEIHKVYVEADEDHVAMQKGHAKEMKLINVYETKVPVCQGRRKLLGRRTFSGWKALSP